MYKTFGVSLLKFIVLIVLALMLVSCQPSTSSSVPVAKSNGIDDVRVIAAEPTESRVGSETFPLPNCGGTSELHQTLGTHASIFKSVTVSDRASVKGGGSVEIAETVKLKLEIEVERTYQSTYQAANSRLDTIDMPAAAGTHVIYQIGWYEQVFSSMVQYSTDDQVYEVPYTYKLRIPKIDNSDQIDDCDGKSTGNNGQGVMPTVQPTTPSLPTPEARPSETPFLPTATANPIAPPQLQPPWDILLSNWQEPNILKQYGDKIVVAVGPFIFKVRSSKGNYCGVVTPGTTLDSEKEFGTPLLEYWTKTRDDLIAFLTMSDGKNNDSYDMEDFCLDQPVYTFVILHETNGAITMQKMNLPILPGP
jgi:hypothetical protein